MINLFELLAKQFASSATKDIGRSVDAVASGDVKKIAGGAFPNVPIVKQSNSYNRHSREDTVNELLQRIRGNRPNIGIAR